MVALLDTLSTDITGTSNLVHIYNLKTENYEFVNQELYRQLGYDEQDAEDPGEPLIRKIYNPVDYQRYLTQHLPEVRRLKDDEETEFDYRLKTKYGTYRWFHAYHKVIARNVDRQPVLLLEYMQKSSEQVNIRRSQKILQRFFDTSEDFLAVLDKEGRIACANQRFLSALDLGEAEVYGRHFLSIVHADDSKKIFSSQQSQKTGNPAEEFEASIGHCPVARWRLHYDEAEQVYRLVGRNQSLERDRDEAIEEREKLIRLLMEHTSDMICCHRPNGEYDYLSPSWERLTGYDREELRQQNLNRYLHPEDSGRVQQLHQILLNSDSPGGEPAIPEIEYRFRKKDGTYLWLNTTLTPVVENGKTTALITSSRDVTDRKRWQLASDHCRQQLSKSNAEIKNFAYLASHDLIAPLRTISNYLQLLEDRYGSQLDQDFRDFVGFATNGAHRMKRMINALLAYSQTERRFVNQEMIDLNQAVDVAIQNLSESVQNHRVQICCSVLPEIRTNETLMIQLFQSLIDNSIKFRSENEVKIRVDVQESDDKWQFSVKDNGLGIEEKWHDRIFTIFQKINSRIEGTGVGLAIVRRVVDLHGGQVWVESEVGKGTAVVFTIPKPDAIETHEWALPREGTLAG